MEVEHNTLCHKRFATERTCELLANTEAEMIVNKILCMSRPDFSILEWPQTEYNHE